MSGYSLAAVPGRAALKRTESMPDPRRGRTSPISTAPTRRKRVLLSESASAFFAAFVESRPYAQPGAERSSGQSADAGVRAEDNPSTLCWSRNDGGDDAVSPTRRFKRHQKAHVGNPLVRAGRPWGKNSRGMPRRWVCRLSWS